MDQVPGTDHHAFQLVRKLCRKLAAPTPRKRGLNLSRADRKAAAISRTANQNLMWADLQEHWQNEDAMIRELAKKHNKSETWMRLQVCHTGNYGYRRKINKYNAWLHAQSLTINEGMAFPGPL
jgi:hypothetical protein